LRAKLARLPGRKSLHGGNFTGAGFRLPAKSFKTGMKTARGLMGCNAP
jgi:hypothetical protein